MTRAATGIWAAPANTFNPAVAGTAISQTDWASILADIVSGFNENIFCVQTADYTLTDSAAAQKVFNESTNGTVALAASTTYKLDALYLLSNTGTTSHTWATLFAGTAALTSIAYRASARTGITSAATLTAVSDAFTNAATALVVTAASVSSTEFVTIKLDGIIRVNTAGTLIPQIQASAQPNGTEKILKNSYIHLRPVAGNTQGTVGTWT